MTAYDIFNGDADGICALVQLRLSDPRTAKLITGVKRDINLLEKISPKSGDHLTVLDISMKTNMKGLHRALDNGAHVFYVDHHNAGDMPKHENLLAVIDTRPIICTSLLVNKFLQNAHAEWAVMAAFGDNMQESAITLAKQIHLTSDQYEKLKIFGELVNYNGYGSEVSDLHYTPTDLYTRLSPYQSPLTCLSDRPEIYDTLATGLDADFAKAKSAQNLAPSIMLLDDAKWARRVSGYYANWLARQNPDTAHAILTYNTQGGYTVSVRAAQNILQGASDLCDQFPTGGGRAGAAGINHLPQDQLDTFIKAFQLAF